MIKTTMNEPHPEDLMVLREMQLSSNRLNVDIMKLPYRLMRFGKERVYRVIVGDHEFELLSTNDLIAFLRDSF